MKLSLFLSCPIRIANNQLFADNSWLRFAVKLSSHSKFLRIVSPPLLDQENAFCLTIPSNVQHRCFVQHTSFISFYLNLLRHPFRGFCDLIDIVRSCDIILYRIPTPGFCLVALSCLLLKKPFCVFISGDICEQADALSSPHLFTRFFAQFVSYLRINMHKYLCRFSSKCYVVSSDLAKKYKLNPEDYKLFLTPVISDAQFLNKLSAEQDSMETDSQFRMLRSCWIQPSKDLITLLYSCHQLIGSVDFKLTIVGGVKDTYYFDSILQLICKLKLNDYVEFLGHIENTDLINSMTHYHLHLVTSRSEGMPRVCLEAALSRLPQILTNVGGISDFYSDKMNCILINPSSVKELTSAILWAYDNYPLMTKFADQAFDDMYHFNSSNQSRLIADDLLEII